MNKLYHWLIGLSITALVVAVYWFHPPILHRMELLIQNLHFQWRGPISPGSEVVIAAIDEKSIDELGRWPWSRKTLAKLVEKLVDRQARVIGFDMVFSSVDESSGIHSLKNLQKEIEIVSQNAFVHHTVDRYIRRADSDARFGNALQNSKRAVLGYFFHFTPEGLYHLTEKDKHGFFENIKPTQFRGFIKSKADIDLELIDFRTAYVVESNIHELTRDSTLAGFISMDVEPDGSIRKLPLIVRYRDRRSKQDYFFPPFSIRILENYLQGTLLFKVGEFGIEKVLLDSLNPIEVPTNDHGELLINFLGKRKTFPHVSVSDIIHDRKNLVPEGMLKDKIVLVGATATGLEDIHITPFDPLYPGVETHATVIDNILRQNFLHQPDWIPIADSAYLVFWGILLTFLYSRMKLTFSFFSLLAVVVIQLLFAQWMMENKKLWITDVYPLMQNLVILFSLMIYRHNTEEKEKHYIQKVFSKYLSSGIIDQLLKDPGKLNLGGEQKELTAFFTDLEGFTELSEKLTPDEQVNLLNTYLTEMTDILLEHEGTLDKYDGDSIKAFFGAPLFFVDHAKRACMVCIEMQERLQNLRTRWRREGKPELRMRVGINTGYMVVGNIGSRIRMNYGMSGDSVNLTARLEGANKVYGTYSLISESTYKMAENFLEVRELDSIRVVGRVKPVKIFELLGKKGFLEAPVRAILPIYKEGLRHYRMKQWSEAIRCFKKVLQYRSEDGPASTMLKRCFFFKENPPPENWDGVFDITIK